MVATHNLGFARIGRHRELKYALESYWQKKNDISHVLEQAQQLRQNHWQLQSRLDWVPVGDFSLYDHVLDTSLLFGNIPERFKKIAPPSYWDRYFTMARGKVDQSSGTEIQALSLTKWFDTNYHYLMPEITESTSFNLHADRLHQVIQEAHTHHIPAKLVLLGPFTYLKLSKNLTNQSPLNFLPALIATYQQLLAECKQLGVQWVQIDEPILVYELDRVWQEAIQRSYAKLVQNSPSILLTTYFGDISHHLSWVTQLPVQGIHIDGVRGKAQIQACDRLWPKNKVLSIGCIDGRNIWKTDLNAVLNTLEPLADTRQENLWIAPSCSLLHVPQDLSLETALDPLVRSWMAFGVQKLEELQIIQRALHQGREAEAAALEAHVQARKSREEAKQFQRVSVRHRVQQVHKYLGKRHPSFAERQRVQQKSIPLPLLPTTTIGSFPQTSDIRQARSDWKKGVISQDRYLYIMQAEIVHAIREQEALGLDVLVHGEAERNDMVEYFAEQLSGFVFTLHGWVQSYGSRCVKPPIIVGDVERTQPMTVDWSTFAQSQTEKPVKGMLTGPVTILHWSFVRDDQPRSVTGYQIACAIRDEVQDLEKAGIRMIQVDEAALREGVPLKRSEWDTYLEWAVECFQICTNTVHPTTQIHTHMCYSDFSTIMHAIAAMDADVVTIESTRSHGRYPIFSSADSRYINAVGPGVYDIHSPAIPSVETLTAFIQNALQTIPAERLWVNPDCGLKTRRWSEVRIALANMVRATQQVREGLEKAKVVE